MRILSFLLFPLFLAASSRAGVRVFIAESNGLANINYECTAGEVVRAFALDVTVDHGQIYRVTNYFRGLSTAVARGYGIFPASFRDNITVTSGTNANWDIIGYSPVAAVVDGPSGTLPGLNSAGVTLEFGALWDPGVPAAIPPAAGTLCSLRISQTANISISPNAARGGITPSPADLPIASQFTGALVGPAILSVGVANGTLSVRFQSGELETAPSATGPWSGTGNSSGSYTQPVGAAPQAFFRVYQH